MLLNLPEYLVKRKTQIVSEVSSHTAAYLRALATPQPVENPQSLWGNTARMFPVPPAYPLIVDAAIASYPGGLPTVLNYPYAEYAGPYTQSHWACDFQYYIDSTGVIFPIAMMLANKQVIEPSNAQELATSSGEPLVYLGNTFVPGAYIP